MIWGGIKLAKKIKIQIGSKVGVAALLEQEAPVTCERIWESLPFEGDLTHSCVAGREVFLPLPERLEIPPENQTIYPLTGDIGYYCTPSKYVYLDIPLFDRDVEVINLIYDRDTMMYGPNLPLPINHFAVLESGRDELAEEISYMRKNGFGTIKITKMED